MMRKTAVFFVAIVVLGPTTALGGPAAQPCYAEVSPNTVVAGTTGQSFTLKVYNGTSLPVPLPIEEINRVRIWAVWSDLVYITSASALPPWQASVDPPLATTARYRDGKIPTGGSETFSFAGNVENTSANMYWTVFFSRDGWMTASNCQPVRPGALDLIVV
jgi:hypothetical protein